MVVWEKQDGKYVCVREIYNEDEAPAPVETKSIHLFDLPDGITEAEFSATLQKLNEVVAELGYPGFGYHFYKTESPDTEEYRYYFEGTWPSEEAYAEIHEAPAFTAAGQELSLLYQKIRETELYRRVTLVK
jgi:quinol monooxygenase YgiN